MTEHEPDDQQIRQRFQALVLSDPLPPGRVADDVRRGQQRHRRQLLVAAAGAVAVAGITAGVIAAVSLGFGPSASNQNGPAGGTHGEPSTSPSTSTPGTRVAYAAMYMGSSSVQNAELALTANCMLAGGFNYPLAQVEHDKVLPQPFGDNVAQARREGFGIWERYEPFVRNDDAYLALSADEQDRWDARVVSGSWVRLDVLGAESAVQSGGCLGDARAAVYGSAEDYLRTSEIIGTVIPNVLVAAEEDPAVEAAFGLYTECMTSRGYEDIADRGSTRRDAERLVEELGAAAAKPLEIATATDDAECDHSAGYTPTRLRVEDALLARFTDDHGDLVADVREKLAAARVRAETIIDQG